MLQDVEMHRGKPLFLNEERYAALTHMVNLYLSLISHVNTIMRVQDLKFKHALVLIVNF